MNKVSLSPCCAFAGLLQVLSNHNNWSRRSAGTKQGSQCLSRTGQAEGNSAVRCSLHSNHRYAVIQRTQGTTVWWKPVGFVRITCTFPSIHCSSCLCGFLNVGASFKPSCPHIHTKILRILSDIERCLFFSASSITLPLSMNEGFVWFFLQLSTIPRYPNFALCFLAWTDMVFQIFFHLTLTEEMISDWGRDNKRIYPASELGLGAQSKPFWFQRVQTVAHFVFPLPPVTVQKPHKRLW